MIFVDEGDQGIADVAGLDEVTGDGEVFVLAMNLITAFSELFLAFLAFRVGDLSVSGEIEKGVVDGSEKWFVDVNEVEVGLVLESDFGGFTGGCE